MVIAGRDVTRYGALVGGRIRSRYILEGVSDRQCAAAHTNGASWIGAEPRL